MSSEADWFVDLEVESWHRARKPHRCHASGCGIGIRVGDRYRKTYQVFEGRGESWRHCARCALIVDAIARAIVHSDDNSIDPRLDCGHSWRDKFGEPPDDVARLAFMTADEAQELAQ